LHACMHSVLARRTCWAPPPSWPPLLAPLDTRAYCYSWCQPSRRCLHREGIERDGELEVRARSTFEHAAKLTMHDEPAPVERNGLVIDRLELQIECHGRGEKRVSARGSRGHALVLSGHGPTCSLLSSCSSSAGSSELHPKQERRPMLCSSCSVLCCVYSSHAPVA
jgi:hypothetical protein